jgi:hypothetical protein
LRRKLLYAGEVAAVASIVAGTALIFLPAGFILAGILGVFAAERAISMHDRAKGAKK